LFGDAQIAGDFRSMLEARKSIGIEAFRATCGEIFTDGCVKSSRGSTWTALHIIFM
jgi:hypothetical protein